MYKKVAYSVIFALIVFFIAMFANIIPCQTAPVIPNPQYSWALCNINPDSASVVGVSRLYLGYTSSLTQTYLMVLIISFVAALIVLTLTTKRRKE